MQNAENKINNNYTHDLKMCEGIFCGAEMRCGLSTSRFH